MSGEQQMNGTHPDVAIVGGGPAGLSLAGIFEKMGISYVVFEKYGKEDIPRGGCLDMHDGAGQEAFKQAGCFEAFRELSRDGPHTIHQIWDHRGNKSFAWGEGMDKPEIDRFHIKKALLGVVPDEKIRWNAGLTKAVRGPDGKVILEFSDGTSATGFKLVVGADGTWSKVRPLITPTEPRYSGINHLQSVISKDNPFYPKIASMAGKGPMVPLGRKHMMWIQIQANGTYRIELGALAPQDWDGLDYHDTELAKKEMLKDEHFGQFWQGAQDIISAMEGPFRAWPLFHIPPEDLNWAPSADVTLIGDSAHCTLPFVGEGANTAMLDAVNLARNIKEMGIGLDAVAAYEAEMLPRAADVIRRSNISGSLFFDYDSPPAFVKYLTANPSLLKGMV